MARDDRIRNACQLTLGEVDVGAAHLASQRLEQDAPGFEARALERAHRHRCARCGKDGSGGHGGREPSRCVTMSRMSKSMLDAVRRLVDDVVLPNVERWDREDVAPRRTVLDRLGELGVPGALVPAALRRARAAGERDGRRLADAGAGLDLAHRRRQHDGAGDRVAGPLRHGGAACRWLPGIATREVWASFSITEPGAGSDLRRIETWVQPADVGLVITGASAGSPAGSRSRSRSCSPTSRARCGRRASCCPPTAAGATTWAVEPLDKLGYRGVESAAWRFDGHHAPGAEILGGEAGRGKACGRCWTCSPSAA